MNLFNVQFCDRDEEIAIKCTVCAQNNKINQTRHPPSPPLAPVFSLGLPTMFFIVISTIISIAGCLSAVSTWGEVDIVAWRRWAERCTYCGGPYRKQRGSLAWVWCAAQKPSVEERMWCLLTSAHQRFIVWSKKNKSVECVTPTRLGSRHDSNRSWKLLWDM